MRLFGDYIDEATHFADPYIRKTSHFFGNAKEEAVKKYYTEKKKFERRRKIQKIKDFFEDSAKIIMITVSVITAIVAGVVIAKKCINKLSSKKETIIPCDIKAKPDSSEEVIAEPETIETHNNQDNKSCEKKNQDKKSTGYITL